MGLGYIMGTMSFTSYKQMAIPQELSDLILDFLHDDVEALCSAGLVCKSWLPASRFHLFSKVLLSVVVGRELDFLEVICAECSTIPPYILDLGIDGGVECELVDDEADDEDQFGDGSQFVDETLLRLPLLSNLKSLSLMQINMADLTPDAKKRLTNLLQNLTALCLHNVNFETVDQAVDFIASAPRLEDISLWLIGCNESCNYSSQAVAPPLRQIRFELDPLVDNIMDWFCLCHPTPSVHTLEIRQTTTGGNIPTVCKFIRHLGSALQNLTISFFDPIGLVQTALSERIDLSQNSSLRNIFLCNLLPYTIPLRPRPYGWITSIVSSIAHSSLETVTISISFSFLEGIDALELSALDTLFLSQPLSNNSTKLRFSIWCAIVNREVILAALKDGLPKLYGKKRVEFVCV